MAFNVEDGTGLEDSNSYASYAAFLAYFADRGVTVTALQPAVEAALVQATDYMGIRFRWKGTKLTSEQALDWPRACVYGRPSFDEPGGVVIEGVPVEVVKACIEYGNRALTSVLAPDPTVSATGVTVTRTKRKVGPIETEDEFSGSSATSNTLKPYPSADRLVRHLVLPENCGVYRA
jgi:hypothetical protein